MPNPGRSRPVPLSDREVEAIARAFVEARAEARPLDRFPADLPTTLEDAIRVQERALELDGRRPAGWKVAMIRADLRAGLGDERLAGPVFAEAIRDLPHGGMADVCVYVGGFAALEAEFVARFARDLEPGPNGFDDAAILAALSGIHAGSEVASSPLATLNDLGPTAVVCDHGNNAGVVIGPELPGWRDPAFAATPSRMRVDGAVAGEGSAASVPGGPLASLRWLAGHLARRGRRLHAGDVVATGMTTGIHLVRPGMRGRIEFADVAACDIDVTAFGRAHDG
ncbi:MAG: 2-keto-4-pentenoate hydratase [Phyllobacteriaceae bacterium]|nr:2-keto-4-pentenoate hydratase [Phyllobacteriaceae bacterium]